MGKSNVLKFAGAVLFTVIIGGLSGFSTAGEIKGWYAGLQKPSFNPPNYLFGPVWTTLYFLMGISLFLIWKQEVSPTRNQALRLFFVQFLFNICWSFIFFGAHLAGWALIEMAILWILIGLTIFSFAKISKTAAWLLVPYISWVSFAFILNAAIWYLNK